MGNGSLELESSGNIASYSCRDKSDEPAEMCVNSVLVVID